MKHALGVLSTAETGFAVAHRYRVIHDFAPGGGSTGDAKGIDLFGVHLSGQLFTTPSLRRKLLAVLNVATWIRPSDEKWFGRSFAPHPQVKLWNAAAGEVRLAEMQGLLLTGGPDVAAEYLRQPVPDSSILDTDTEPRRDQWEFLAIEKSLARELPIFAICKGMQILNVAMGGTLRLDIPGHNAPEMRDVDVQTLRTDGAAKHRFEKVNSSHHQAVDRAADGFVVEGWCAQDDVIEQMRLTSHPFALAVQYHPERGDNYGALFTDFVSKMERTV